MQDERLAEPFDQSPRLGRRPRDSSRLAHGCEATAVGGVPRHNVAVQDADDFTSRSGRAVILVRRRVATTDQAAGTQPNSQVSELCLGCTPTDRAGATGSTEGST